MPIDLTKEKLITAREAAQLTPGGPVSNDTIYDWQTRGFRCRNGQVIHLDRFQRGSRVFTSAEALTRFLEAVNAASVTATAPVPADPDATQRELLAMGIGTPPGQEPRRVRRKAARAS